MVRLALVGLAVAGVAAVMQEALVVLVPLAMVEHMVVVVVVALVIVTLKEGLAGRALFVLFGPVVLVHSHPQALQINKY